jgi:hypothetical protein
MVGRNGSGKSSLADAIETALHGVPRAPASTGTGGRAPLWEREHCHRDTAEARVEITLVAGAETLTLGTTLDSSGDVVDRTARHTDTDGAVTDVDLSDTSWRSALAGHRPVFGYAAVERQVQLARNLQEFLEPLLAFGGCFEELRAGVEEAGASAVVAQDRWLRGRTAAERAVQEVDRERTGTPPPEIAWPEPGDDPDAWLAAAGLTETGEAAGTGSALPPR